MCLPSSHGYEKPFLSFLFPSLRTQPPDTDLSPLSETMCPAGHCMTVAVGSGYWSLPVIHSMVFPLASLQVNSVTKLERHARSDEREACWSSRLFPGAVELVAPGFLGLSFFSDNLLAAQHNVYLTELLLFVSKQISNKEGSSTEENEGTDPTRANTGSCISDHISRDSLWKHREILGINGGSVWHPFGSVLCSFSTLSSCKHVHCFHYYFFFCKTSVWI